MSIQLFPNTALRVVLALVGIVVIILSIKPPSIMAYQAMLAET